MSYMSDHSLTDIDDTRGTADQDRNVHNTSACWDNLQTTT